MTTNFKTKLSAFKFSVKNAHTVSSSISLFNMEAFKWMNKLDPLYFYIIIFEMQSKDKIFSKRPKSLKHSKV